jgi:hypothetical protein
MQVRAFNRILLHTKYGQDLDSLLHNDERIDLKQCYTLAHSRHWNLDITPTDFINFSVSFGSFPLVLFQKVIVDYVIFRY